MDRRSVVRKCARVDRILAKTYGIKKQRKFSDPTEELILTVLSQNTNDINRDRAFDSLRTKFPNWEDVVSARNTEIARAIKVGGLGNIKSGRIKKILGSIRKETGGFSLRFLNKTDDQEAWRYLTGFEGVGPKTASCVMMFSLGRKTMPVDTHVLRVGKRLGLIPEEFNADAAHEWFRDLNVPVDVYQMHLNLISHGRTLCRPARPKCDQCPLTKECVYFSEIER